jgi:3-methyl-2-oxobutanoate hydroxymethyltransferase
MTQRRRTGAARISGGSFFAATADESIPVMGHLGFVPRKSTWVGGIRAVGKTSAEALGLWDRFLRLEDAGAFGVECELIAGAVMSEINRRTSLVTVSLGSGAEADVIFLFTSDICGEATRLPRHARAWGDLRKLHNAVREDRMKALSGFRSDVASGGFPTERQVAGLANAELAEFRAELCRSSSRLSR